jgi:2,4-dienoyl-CoA reductase-like NADH-dependent reductase (Old Yellow Enzyme family)
MATLFTPIRFREIELKNRIVVSPMCEYSAVDGHPQPWHLVHLGSRAVGGAALVMAEATAVEQRGRISPADTGLYLDAHIESWKPIANFIRSQGAVPGIQLAHAGRKASTAAPWLGGKPLTQALGGWEPVSASPLPFDEGYPAPKELSSTDLKNLVNAFAQAAQRALAAGFEVVEIHSAHGYLLHQFLSPLTNQRKDEYGDSFENRTRLALQVTKAVRAAWPERLPLFYRLSATDWVEGGWDIEQSIELARRLKSFGVDLIDSSSGGTVPRAKIPAGPGFQVPFAETIRNKAGIATGAVGYITDARQAEEILSSEKADVVLLARELLRDPYWPRRAAKELGYEIKPPVQYERAW